MLSYAQISSTNILNNIKSIKKLLPKTTKLCGVIKGNAYGHGQEEVSKIIENAVDFFQVDDIAELTLLRKTSNKPTFVFGYVANDELEKLVKLNGIPGIYDIKQVLILDKLAKKFAKKIKVHIKIDALLGRQGLLIKDIPDFINKIRLLTNIEFDGIYSHFSNIEDTDDLTHAKKQLAYFDTAIKIFSENDIKFANKHFSATSGILVGKLLGKSFEIARLGIGMYGLWPSESLRIRFESKVHLKPALSWITHIAQVKTVEKGFPIGYGLTYIVKKPTKIAVIPQGYSDGYDRSLSNCGRVLINNRFCPVIGRVAMNMFVVDVSNINAEQGDEVILIGNKITPEEIAGKLGTINYEVVTRISPLLPRIVV